MDHDTLTALRRQHPAWRLLAAENAPFIIGFLHLAFVASNRRAITEADLIEQLEDYLHHLRQSGGIDLFPRTAVEYLRDWAGGEQAIVRRYYAHHGDEVFFDLTPASELAIQWLAGFEPRAFVGTESRLLTVIEMLRDLVQMAETDPQARLATLERRREELDAEIRELQAGRFTPGDPRQIKERLFALEDNARSLLGDFRQIEENFRQLDRDVRERIAVADATKGVLLDEVFDKRDTIADSDQGKSFSAFWSLLMSPRMQEELADLLKAVNGLDVAHDFERDGLLGRIQDYLLDAGQKVQRTTALLTEQLRRFLDDKVWLENKRIMALIQGIQTHAIAVHQTPPDERKVAEVDLPRVDLNLPLSRGLFRPNQKIQIDSSSLLDGSADFDDEALYNIFAVDQAQLHRQIERALEDQPQVSLGEICARFPIRQGLSEVISYVQIASNDPHAVLGESPEETLAWDHPRGWRCEARIPRILFTRPSDRIT